MYRYFAIVLLLFMIFGCGISKKISLDLYTPQLQKDDINFLILKALNSKDEMIRLKSYEKLYNITKKKVYLKELIAHSLELGKYDISDKYLDIALKKHKNDKEFLKFKVSRLADKKKYESAKNIMLKLLAKDKSSENYMALGSIKYLQKKYKKAFYYYNLAYKKASNEDALLKIVALLDENLDQKQKAINYLENYIRFKKASKQVYINLLQIYSSKMDINGLISTYKKLYKNFKEDEYGKKVVELYAYKEDLKGAIRFLEKTGFEPEVLLDLYTSVKNYKKALKLTKKLYEKTNNIDYLGKTAIYEYEAYEKNISRKRLKSISKKFEEVIEKKYDPLYLNYYGYLLIEHNLDIQKGIDYVKLALKKEPNSTYYIDSLAWGLYKQRKCKEALMQMKKIIDKTDEKEIKKHFNLIKKCTN